MNARPLAVADDIEHSCRVRNTRARWMFTIAEEASFPTRPSELIMEMRLRKHDGMNTSK